MVDEVLPRHSLHMFTRVARSLEDTYHPLMILGRWGILGDLRACGHAGMREMRASTGGLGGNHASFFDVILATTNMPTAVLRRCRLALHWPPAAAL